MCGIGGTQGVFSSAVAQAISCAFAHRGPDGDGLVSYVEHDEIETHLAHRRLSIIDLSADANQPMRVGCAACNSTAAAGLTIVFNGEIYNFQELKTDLEAAGHEFTLHSDTEVLLHAYGHWGMECLERLNGIFAFAIRDGRVVGRPQEVPLGALVLARDQMGVKPLYIATTKEGFLFSSELRPLLPFVGATVDPQALVDLLQYLWVPSPRTIVREVSKVEPSVALIVSNGKITRRWRYHSESAADVQPYGGSLASAASEVRARLKEAVRRQMISDVPVGTFLSGGVDSSAIASLMAEVSGGTPPSCYTVRFQDEHESMDGAEQDLPFARKVAGMLGARLHEVETTPQQLLALRELVVALDEPHADPAPANALFIARAAKKDGISVLLSGAGGDDLFTGYRRHWALVVSERLARVPKPLFKLAAFAARIAAMPGSPLRARAHQVLRTLARARVTTDERIIGLFAWTPLPVVMELLSSRMKQELAKTGRSDLLQETLNQLAPGLSPLQRMLALERRYFLADHNLLYTDKMGMAAGVEIRVPFLDRDLVRFALSLPVAFMQRGRDGKHVLKRAIRGLVPDTVIDRQKTGFGVPLRRWLKQELVPLVDEILSLERLERRGYLDPSAVRRLIEADRRGESDAAYLIYALLTLELWFAEVPERVASAA